MVTSFSFSVICTESIDSIFLWCDDDQKGPIALCSIDEFCCRNLGDVFCNQLKELWTVTVWLLVH